MPDWRDERAYEKLKPLDRQGFAWEYLRRNPGYRDDQRNERVKTSEIDGITIIDRLGPPPNPDWGLRFP